MRFSPRAFGQSVLCSGGKLRAQTNDKGRLIRSQTVTEARANKAMTATASIIRRIVKRRRDMGSALGGASSGEEAEALSDGMMDAWIAFAKSGNPSNDTSGAWLRYDTAKRATMMFGGGAPHMSSAPNEGRRKAWDQVPAAKIGP